MAFTVNSLLSHVAIDESILYEVYRSVDKKVPVDSRISSRECEAFICSAQESGVMKIYVALWEVNTRRTIVLVPTINAKGLKEYPDLLGEARQFLLDQGFFLEQVRLDFSVAMRQTIMKTIRVLQPPPKPAVTDKSARAIPVAVTENYLLSQDISPPEPSLSATATLSDPARVPAATEVLSLATVAAPAATAELAAQAATIECLQAKIRAQEQRAFDKTAELEHELAAERRQRQEAEAQLDEMDSLREGLATREAEIKKFVSARTEQRKADHEWRKMQKGLVAEVAALQQELAVTRGTIGQMSGEKIAAVEAQERAIAEKSVLEQEIALERKRRQEAELEGDGVAILQQSLAEQADELAGIRQELGEAQAELSELRTEHGVVLSTREELIGQLANRNEELQSVRRQLAKDQQTVKKLGRELTESKAAADRSRSAFDEELASLRDARETLEQAIVEALAAAPAEQEIFAKEMADFRQELARQRSLGEARSTELAGIRQELGESQAELTRLRTEHGVVLGSREELIGQMANRNEELQSVRRQLAKDQQTVKKLGRELTESKAAADRSRSAFAEELTSLRTARETLEQAIVEALAAAPAEQEMLAKEIEDLQQELARLRSAGEAQSADYQKQQEEVRAVIARLQEELRIQESAANREQAALRAEIRSVIAENTAGASRSAEPVPAIVPVMVEPNEAEGPYRSPTALAYAAILEAGDSGPALPFVELGDTESYTVFVRDDPSGGFGWDNRSGGSTGIQFRPDRALTSIPCPSPESLVALYESVNKVQSAPDGYEPQRCGGYVCVLNRNGIDEVYLAWFMEQSRTVQVCRPCQPLTDGASLEQILQDAIFYFESAGLMMEPVELDAPKKRDRQLKRIPVFTP